MFINGDNLVSDENNMSRKMANMMNPFKGKQRTHSHSHSH